MNAALVYHDGVVKGFWFVIPNDLDGKVKIGDHVMCSTRYGKQMGEVRGIAFNVDNHTQQLVDDGAKFPLMKILYRLEYVPMCDIIIPGRFKLFNPKPDKMYKRFVEFEKYGYFITNISVMYKNGEYTLTDGYTAYLVSEMLDNRVILCRVVDLDETN